MSKSFRNPRQPVVSVEYVKTEDESDTYESLCVKAPDSKAFLAEARALKGRWDAQYRNWWFAAADEAKLMAALESCYVDAHFIRVD